MEMKRDAVKREVTKSTLQKDPDRTFTSGQFTFAANRQRLYEEENQALLKYCLNVTSGDKLDFDILPLFSIFMHPGCLFFSTLQRAKVINIVLNPGMHDISALTSVLVHATHFLTYWYW